MSDRVPQVFTDRSPLITVRCIQHNCKSMHNRATAKQHVIFNKEYGSIFATTGSKLAQQNQCITWMPSCATAHDLAVSFWELDVKDFYP